MHQRARQRHDRHDHEESAEQHVEAERCVIRRCIARETGECAAVIPRTGAERVQNFAQSVRAIVIQSRQAPFSDYGPGSKTENGNGEDEQREHRHLYVVRFDFFAEVFRRTTDHQTRDKDREHNENQHAV